MWRKENPLAPLVGMQIDIPTMENSMESPYTEKIIIQKDTCTPMFTAALYTIARSWKWSKCPSTDEWTKMWYLYTMQY